MASCCRDSLCTTEESFHDDDDDNDDHDDDDDDDKLRGSPFSSPEKRHCAI